MKFKSSQTYMLRMIRYHYIPLITTIILPAMLTFLVWIVIVLSRDKLSLKSDPKNANLQFFGDDFKNQNKDALWFGFSPDNQATRVIAENILKRLNINEADAIFFSNKQQMDAHIRSANLKDKAKDTNFVQVLVDSLNTDRQKLQYLSSFDDITLTSTEVEDLNNNFISDFMGVDLKDSSQSKPILFAIDFDIKDGSSNYTLSFNDDAIYWYYFNLPNKQNTKFGHFFTSYYWSSHAYKLQLEIEAAIFEFVTNSDPKEVVLHALPRTSDVSLYNWQKMYVSVLATMGFSFVFVFSFLTKIRQNSYVLLKRLGVPDWDFWCYTYLVVFVTLWLSLFCNFLVSYWCEFLPFAYFKVSVVFVLPFPIAFCFSSFAVFMAMLFKSDTLQIVSGTLVMLSFTMFPVLLAVFMYTMKSTWDPSFIPQFLSYAAAVVSPIFTAFCIVEQFAMIAPSNVKQSYIWNKMVFAKQNFGYIYSQKWHLHDFPQMMDPTLSFHVPSFDFYWWMTVLQTAVYFGLCLLISYVKTEKNQVGRKIFQSKRKLPDNVPPTPLPNNEHQALLVLKNVSKSFKQKSVLQAIDFEILPNKVYGIIGSSGSGKTTLLNIIAGLVQENQTVNSYMIFDEQKINNPCPQLLRQKMSICPQDKSNVFDHLSIKENVKLCMELSDNVDKKFVDEMIVVLNLENSQNKCFHQLSGGMQRRFALLMALIQKPKLLLLDEITANVDPMLKRHIWDALMKFQEKNECAVILTSHDSQEMCSMANYVLFLHDGVIKSQNTIVELARMCDQMKLIYNVADEGLVIAQLEKLNIRYVKQSQLKESTIQLKNINEEILSQLSLSLENMQVVFRIESYQVNEIIYHKIDEVITPKNHIVSSKKHQLFSNLIYQLQKQWFQSINTYCVNFIITLLFIMVCALIGVAAYSSVYNSDVKNYQKLANTGKVIAAMPIFTQLQAIILQNDKYKCDNFTCAFKIFIQDIEKLGNSQKLKLMNQSYYSYYRESSVRYFDHLNFPVMEKYQLSFGDGSHYYQTNRTNQQFYLIQQNTLSVDDQITNNQQVVVECQSKLQSSCLFTDLEQILVPDREYKYLPNYFNANLNISSLTSLLFNSSIDALNYYYKAQLSNLKTENYTDLSELQKLKAQTFTPNGIINNQESRVDLYLQLPNNVIERSYNNSIQYFQDTTLVGQSLLHEQNISLQQKFKDDADETYFVNTNNDVITKVYAMMARQNLNSNNLSWQANYVPQPKYSTLQKMFNESYQRMYFADLIIRYFIPFSETLMLVICLQQIHDDLQLTYLTFLNGVSVNPFVQQLNSFLCHIVVFLIKSYINQLVYYFILYSESYDNVIFWVMPIFVAIQNISLTYFLVFVLQSFSMECIYICISVVITIVVGCIMQPPIYIQAILTLFLPGMYSYTINIQAVTFQEVSWIWVGVLISLVQLLLLQYYHYYKMKHNLNKVKRQTANFKKMVSSESSRINSINSSIEKQELVKKFSMDDTFLLQARGVEAFYKKNTIILQGFNIDVSRNKTTCLVGVNGSGKSTFLKCLIGAEVKFSGDIYFNAKIGIVPQDDACMDLLTVRQNLQLMCNFSTQSVAAAIDQFGLQKEQFVRAKDLSSGQRRRLTIAMAVVTNPELLVLDEVTVGLDYELKRDLWAVITQLRDCAILAITHDMTEIDCLADDCCILDEGAIVRSGPVSEIKELGKFKYVVSLFGVDASTLDSVLIAHRVEGVEVAPRRGFLELKVRNGVEASDIFKVLGQVKKELPGCHFAVETAQMESVFVGMLRKVRQKGAQSLSQGSGV